MPSRKGCARTSHGRALARWGRGVGVARYEVPELTRTSPQRVRDGEITLLPGKTMTDTRFNDEEVSLILARALEADTDRSDGLTLSQLKGIASEVGIDPAEIESAALAVQANRMVGSHGMIGARTSTRYEVEIEGEVDHDDYADLVRVIRGALGRQGIVTEEFGGLQWTARDAFGGRYVTVRSEKGRTRVEALGNFRDGAFLGASLGGVGGLGVSAVLVKATVGLTALGAGLPLALALGAAVPAYALYRRWFIKEDAALRRAVADVSAQVEARVEEDVPDHLLGAPPETE